ncbi:MAG: DegT/DnrJ/EryC1/StrS aminotransferase family protein [Planctomycetaceae bacterium]|nr:MAG: DegT/DnrJ/EryC1/StrS aminotransferase family protein [Planctomycetaceae bacterium]
MIPLLRPSVTQAEIDAVTDVLKSGWWGQGRVVEQFETELAARYNYAHCITTNSATAALHLALKACGVGPGYTVALPALTFISTALAVTYCGATPVFCDVREDTLTMDWETGADVSMPVDYAGYPAMDRGMWGPIVQDAAHSCGGIGYGYCVCLSFHPVKNLATGDGGAVLTNDDKIARRIRALRWCGIDRSTWDRSQKRYSWDYDISEVGYKYHWNDIQAAIGLAQLRRLDEINAERRRLAMRYSSLLKGVQLPIDHAIHTWHLYAIRVDRRDDLIDRLAEKGIGAGVHYKPLTYYSMYRGETPPVTEREWRRLVSLPLYVGLTEQEQDRVIDVVNHA